MAEGAGGMTYIRMMTDILSKKKDHLERILEYTKGQEEIGKRDVFAADEFIALVE